MIGDQLKREPPPSRYLNPDEPLAGKCMTCGTIVRCLRRDTDHGRKKPQLGTWDDLLSVECPGCRARVFVMLSTEFRETVKEVR